VHFFVTGTDTGVGKTYFSRLLIDSFRQERIDAVGYKPVCTGDRYDVLTLAEASGGIDPDLINPVWLKAAVAPYVAGMLENRPVDPQELIAGFRRLAADHASVILEGAGGWRVPLAEGYAISDLAADLAIPVILVVGNRLGALNHTILTVESIRARGVPLAGLVINQLQDELDTAAITNKGVIEKLTGAPILAEIIHGQDFLDTEPFHTWMNR
jgi:dethiobiotin synthetase